MNDDIAEWLSVHTVPPGSVIVCKGDDIDFDGIDWQEVAEAIGHRKFIVAYLPVGASMDVVAAEQFLADFREQMRVAVDGG